jgi:hypothetical protein
MLRASVRRGLLAPGKPASGAGNICRLDKVESSRLKSVAKVSGYWQTCADKAQLQITTHKDYSWHER